MRLRSNKDLRGNLDMAGISTKMLIGINSIVVPWKKDFLKKDNKVRRTQISLLSIHINTFISCIHYIEIVFF